MKHGVKKIKFSFGKNATKMLVRKLVYNFVTKGKITTTKAKAKVIQRVADHLVSKAKVRSEANKNVLLKSTGNVMLTNLMFDKVGPVFKDKTSGFTRFTRLGKRRSDGSEMILVEWTKPVILEEKKVVVNPKTSNKKQEKKEDKKEKN